MIDNEQVLHDTQVESPIQEGLEATDTQPTPFPIKKDTKHFAELRQKAERIERERDEALRMLDEARRASEPIDDDDINIDNDALAEGKHLKKLQAKYRKLEEKLSSYEKNSSTLSAESRLRATYPDIDAVVSKENIYALKEQYPELATSLDANQDLYTKGAAAYTMIKKLGIAGQVDREQRDQQQPDYSQERETIQRNFSKPRSSQVIAPNRGSTPLQQANPFAQGLTPELRKALLQEMNEAAKNR